MTYLPNDELVDDLKQFYRRYYSDDIGELAQNYPNEQRSLYVDWTDLYRFDADLADDFISQPDTLREYAEEALMLYDSVDVHLGQANVRVGNLDSTTAITQIRSRHINTLVSIQGTVERASEVRSELIESAFECQRCGTLTYIPQDRYGDEQEPHECQGCERQGPFEVNQEQSEYEDAQTLVVKRRPSNVTTDDEASIAVELRDDLAGAVAPGDTVTVTGVIRVLNGDQRTDASIADKYLTAHAVTVDDEAYRGLTLTDKDKKEIVELSQRDDIYEQMVESVAPTVYGYEQEKLAIILQLFSGVTKHLPDETRLRGDLHVAFIGEPGTGKSRLLDYAGLLAPWTVSVSGKTTTSVGLTATAKKTSNGTKTWTFEAGALPLADRGLATIDNIDHLSSEQRATLEEVLEDQKIELNKATVSATIKARTSVLTAAGPKYGRFDQYEPVGEQVDLTPGLISKFDLLFTFTDQPDEDRDAGVADRVLEVNYAGELNTQRAEMSAPNISESEVKDAVEQVAPAIAPEVLRKYVAYARRNCFPTMTDAAKDTIEDFYVSLRSKGVDEDAPVPVTARQLEALVRLAEASARVRLSDVVEQQDAERAVELTRSCLRDLGVDPETGQDRRETVETGTSKSQRDRSKNLKQLIADIEEKHEEGAPVEKVMARVDEIGMEQSKTEYEIEKLKDKGEVYEPAKDHLRTT